MGTKSTKDPKYAETLGIIEEERHVLDVVETCRLREKRE